MRVTEARGKESVFNGASRGRRYGGRRIERRRPISRLRAATMMRRASLKKKGYLPNQSKGTFWCGVWAKTRIIRSTKTSLLLRVYLANSGTSLRSTSSWLLCRRRRLLLLSLSFRLLICRRRRFRRWFYCAWCGASSSSTRLGTIYEMEGALFQKKKCVWFRVYVLLNPNCSFGWCL